MAALPPGPLSPPGGGAADAAGPEGAEGLFVLLGAGLVAASHPLLYVKLLVQVGHEPLPPTIGRNVLGRKVLYLPGFFTYARHIVEVDGKRGLFRGLTPRLISSTLSTITRGSVKKAFPLEDMEHVSNKDDVKTSLRKVVRETSHEMMMQCVSRFVSHPLHVISMRCMVQFVGREVKYSGVFSAIGRIFKEEGILGFFVGLVPHILGDVIFLWCCNLLAHFINTYAVDDNFSQASVIRSYTKFVMGIAVSMLTYPFLLVGDLMAVNNCGCRYGPGLSKSPGCVQASLPTLPPLHPGSTAGGTSVLRGSCSVAPACCSAGRPSQPPPSPSTEPRQGQLISVDSSRNPKLVSISVYFSFLIQSPWCHN
uniref:Mitochondrial carrier homolog 1 n=1 Tax=Taeniopygia guttata TaxID=59729 RepID=H0YRQ5_TAEGU